MKFNVRKWWFVWSTARKLQSATKMGQPTAINRALLIWNHRGTYPKLRD